jgi:regulator of replication initiation timing
LNEKINYLNNTNDTLSTNIRNLKKDNDKLKHEKIRNDILVKENNDLKDNNKKLKRKLDESDKAFDNLLKKSKK